ncbi:hypothetical protein ACHMW5_29435 [Azospirillum melinis]
MERIAGSRAVSASIMRWALRLSISQTKPLSASAWVAATSSARRSRS